MINNNLPFLDRIVHSLDSCIAALDAWGTDYLWGYGALFTIITLGILLSIRAKFFQVFQIKQIFKLFLKSLTQGSTDTPGVKPRYVFFTSLGGCVGIGNIATVASAVHIGGPGSLLWLWVIAFIGMTIKYSEVYLALKYRFLSKDKKSYVGGSMYFVAKAFPGLKWLPKVAAVLMTCYAIEFYSFNVVKDSFVENFNVDPLLFTVLFIAVISYTVLGGMQRVGKVNVVLMPIFVSIYLLMTAWVLIVNASAIIPTLKLVWNSAFSPLAPIAGFGGATMMLALSKGASAAAFSGDMGVGYNSIVHIDAQTDQKEQQSSLALMSIFVDTLLICTATMLLVLITGVWVGKNSSALLVQDALSTVFPYMNYFMPILVLLLGFTTIISYLVSGIRTSTYLSPKHGKQVFFAIAPLSFFLFAFFKADYAFAITSFAGGLLLYIHMAAILKLNKEINFDLKKL